MGTSVIVFTIKMVKKEKMGLHSFNLEKGGNAYNYINPIKSLLGFFFFCLCLFLLSFSYDKDLSMTKLWLGY